MNRFAQAGDLQFPPACAFLLNRGRILQQDLLGIIANMGTERRMHAEILKKIDAALEDLIVKALMEGVTYAEIARRVGTSQQNVHKKFSKRVQGESTS